MVCPRMAAASLLLAVLTGCATPYPVPVPEPKDAEVTGIVEYIQHAALNNSSGPIRVDIVATHGMCVHGASWEAAIIQTMEAVLGVPRQSTSRKRVAGASEFGARVPVEAGAERPPVASEPDLNREPFVGTTKFAGESGGIRLKRGQSIEVVLHTIVWSPLVMPARDALCYDVSSDTENVCDGIDGRARPGF
jgi:hypothetical protein